MVPTTPISPMTSSGRNRANTSCMAVPRGRETGLARLFARLAGILSEKLPRFAIPLRILASRERERPEPWLIAPSGRSRSRLATTALLDKWTAPRYGGSIGRSPPHVCAAVRRAVAPGAARGDRPSLGHPLAAPPARAGHEGGSGRARFARRPAHRGRQVALLSGPRRRPLRHHRGRLAA